MRIYSTTIGENLLSLEVISLTNNEVSEEKPSFEETQPCSWPNTTVFLEQLNRSLGQKEWFSWLFVGLVTKKGRSRNFFLLP